MRTKKSQALAGIILSRVENLRTWVEVDTGALRHNLRQARRVIGLKTKLMIVVKSNAYGHGLVGAAKVAVKNGIDYLGVDSLDEGIILRKAGIKVPTVILGYTPLHRLKDVSKFDFETSVYNKETILVLAKVAKISRKPVKVHLKIETGTSRQGIIIEELPVFTELLKRHNWVMVGGVYTHFADTENITSTFYRKQLAMFQKAVRILEEAGYRDFVRHAASSAALFLYPETHFDMVRLGISYYGLWPSEAVEYTGKRRGIILRPALMWKTKIAQVKYLKGGTTVGYDRTERLKNDSRIAVLPVGYWDGYDRKLSRTGEVLVGGERCRVLGRVCMNMTMIDVTKLKNLRTEELVVILGRSGKEEITVEELAQKIGTINYEIITRINPLIPRIYK